MVKTVVKEGLNGGGLKTQTKVDCLLGVRKSVVYQWFLAGNKIWTLVLVVSYWLIGGHLAKKPAKI